MYLFQVLQPIIDQNPIFGNSVQNGSSTFLKWEYGAYKVIEWAGGVFSAVLTQDTWNVVKAVLSVVSIFCITVILYCSVRMFEIRKKEHHHIEEEIREYAHHRAEKEKEKEHAKQVSENPDWVRVISMLSSDNPAQWKLAVMEADDMLGRLMGQLGFKGDSLGEKLKSADQKHFKHLSMAWEAHAVRNHIAHEGASFELTLREARRVVALYEVIFQEFGFI